jgi:phospholipid transport system substrate-binding protein
MKAFYGLLSALAFLAGAVQAAEVAPDVLVKDTAQEVLAIVKKDKDIQAGDRKKIYDLVEAKVLPHFDFRRMTQLAVGRYWRQASPEQQEALVNEFRTLLVRTYSTSLTAYKDQVIEYRPLRLQPGDTDVTVKTVVRQTGGQPPVPIDYSLILTPNGWKVYDVTVDNISLVTNYRSSFATEIRTKGVDGLIRSLAEKNKAEGAPNGPAKK